MLALQCMHDNLLKRHGFCWALHAKLYPSVKSTEKIQVKHDLGKRLYGGQGQSKIGGANLCHVGITMHACKFVEKAWLLLGAARKVVPISKNRQRKAKLNTTSGRGYMEVNVKTTK